MINSGWSKPYLDRHFNIETVGFLKPSDNVDGLFSEYLTSAVSSYFKQQGQFELTQLHKTEKLLTTSKIPYSKLIYDNHILSQLSKVTHSASLIRTKILKEGTQYQFTMDWLHSADMSLIASTTFSVPNPANGVPFDKDVIKRIIQNNLKKLVAQLPYQGEVTGRDGQNITVNMGINRHLMNGDILSVGTIEEVKIHPIYRRIDGWKLSSAGKVVIERVDSNIAFCKVLKEDPHHPISRFQKITEVERLLDGQTQDSSTTPLEMDRE